jgi:hypothetical protein
LGLYLYFLASPQSNFKFQYLWCHHVIDWRCSWWFICMTLRRNTTKFQIALHIQNVMRIGWFCFVIKFFYLKKNQVSYRGG